MWISIIFFSVCTVGMLVFFVLSDNSGLKLFLSPLLIITIMLFTFSILKLDDNIKPIDVYRGKTELKINVEIIGNDTIVTDSVVVLKEKYLEKK